AGAARSAGRGDRGGRRRAGRHPRGRAAAAHAARAVRCRGQRGGGGRGRHAHGPAPRLEPRRRPCPGPGLRRRRVRGSAPVALNVARESRQARANRARAIARGLARTYPDAWCELDYRTPWQLVVATILSAQCTDKMVNRVTPTLWKAFRTPAALAAADPARVEALIKPTGFFRQQTRAIPRA